MREVPFLKDWGSSEEIVRWINFLLLSESGVGCEGAEGKLRQELL